MLREAGDTTTFEGMDPDGPLPPFVTADENLAAAVDAQEYHEQKMAALAAHATQITTDGPFFALSNNVGTTAWGIEFYRIAKGQRGTAQRGRPRDRPVRGCVDALRAKPSAPRTHRAALLCLILGLVVGLSSVALHHYWWGLLLAIAATSAAAYALPAGWWARMPFAIALGRDRRLSGRPTGRR